MKLEQFHWIIFFAKYANAKSILNDFDPKNAGIIIYLVRQQLLTLISYLVASVLT